MIVTLVGVEPSPLSQHYRLNVEIECAQNEFAPGMPVADFEGHLNFALREIMHRYRSGDPFYPTHQDTIALGFHREGGPVLTPPEPPRPDPTQTRFRRIGDMLR